MPNLTPCLGHLAAPLCIAALSCAAAADPLLFPGTAWTIDPPTGFVLVSDPVALLKNPAGAFVIVAQFPPAPVPDDRSRPGDVLGSGKDRARVDVVERIDAPGRTGFYMEARLLDRNTVSFVYHVTTATSTVLANAVIPDAAAPGTDMDALRRSLRSLAETGADMADRMAGYPLAVPDLAEFTLVNVVGDATAVWTDGPVPDMRDSATQRFIVVAVVNLPDIGPVGKGADAALAASLRARDPGLRVLDSSMESHAGGMHGVVRYVRRHETGVTVGGMALVRQIGPYLVTLIGQFPESDTTTFDTFRDLFRDITLRPQP